MGLTVFCIDFIFKFACLIFALKVATNAVHGRTYCNTISMTNLTGECQLHCAGWSTSLKTEASSNNFKTYSRRSRCSSSMRNYLLRAISFHNRPSSTCKISRTLLTARYVAVMKHGHCARYNHEKSFETIFLDSVWTYLSKNHRCLSF